MCGANNTAPGTATPSQVTGDCHQNQCDGNGGVTNAIDNTDTKSDNNDCTTDTCSNGTLTYTPTAPRTVCAGGGGKVLCDGSGVCVGCLVPADCGSDTICATQTCNAGACGVNNTSAGTWCAGTDAGVDAGESVCDGLGACLP